LVTRNLKTAFTLSQTSDVLSTEHWTLQLGSVPLL